MRTELLKRFVVAAETLNFSHASARLHLSQTTMVKSVATLEQEIGCALFIRTTRRVQLTEYGKALLPFAIRCCDALDEGLDTLDWLKRSGAQEIRLGSFCLSRHARTKRAVEAFEARVEAQRVVLSENDPIDLAKQVFSGDLDAAIVPLRGMDDIPDDIEMLHLGICQEVFVFPSGHPFAQLDAIPPSSLDGQTVIMPHRMLNEETSALLSAVTNEGHPRITHVDSVSSLMELVSHGRGVGIAIDAECGNLDGLTTAPANPAQRYRLVLLMRKDLDPAIVEVFKEVFAVGE